MLSKRFLMLSLALFILATTGAAGYWWANRTRPYATTSTDPRVQNAYAVARKMPQVLSQLPCLCGCMDRTKNPHASNLDCFKTEHAETCPICVITALSAERTVDQGKSIKEISRYITNVNGFDMVPELSK